MSIPEIESADQLNVQLHGLLGETRIHFSKRRKILLQLERKNNQLRRLIYRSDLEKQQKVIDNGDLIRRIKKIIIEEDRQQSQGRRNEHEQNRYWSLGKLTGVICMVTVGAISIATLIMMMMIMLDRSKEKYI